MNTPREASPGVLSAISWRDIFRRLRGLEHRNQQVRAELQVLVETVRSQSTVGYDLAREQAGFGRDLQHLQQRLEALNKVMNVGNGERALTTRLAVMEAEFEDLKAAFESQSREHWKLLASLATGVLSLLSSLVLWLVKGGS